MRILPFSGTPSFRARHLRRGRPLHPRRGARRGRGRRPGRVRTPPRRSRIDVDDENDAS